MRPCRWLPRREICIPRKETCSRASACTLRSLRAASFPRPSVYRISLPRSIRRRRAVGRPSHAHQAARFARVIWGFVFPVPPLVWAVNAISFKFRVDLRFENRKRAGNVSHDASRVHARHARGSGMSLEALDAMESGSPPRETHRMPTRCARPPFRFHPPRVGTIVDLEVAGD